jgi:hypothetical protein
MVRIFFIFLFAITIEIASAHHSNDYHFDRNVDVTVRGTVKMFRFINPHSRLLVDVLGVNGEIVTWDCEMAAANGLQRKGWTEDVFTPGDEIVIHGFAARRNETECYFDVAQLSDGRNLSMSDSFNVDASEQLQSARTTLVNTDIPNFNHVWQRARGDAGRPPAGGPRLGGPNRNAWVLSEAGRLALDSYDSVFDDPALECSPVSIRRLWGNNDLTEIEQTADLVIIRHEWMDAVREVDLTLDQHSESLEPRELGYSIGWYEGPTLVIDTVGYEAGMLEQHPGLPHSEQLHTLERLTLTEDGDTFEITIMMEDALYFTDQLTASRSFVVANATPQDYNCTHPELGH